MGLLNEVIGAVVAETALDKLDPGAGLLKKGMAAIAGFEGEKVIEEKIDEHQAAEQQAADQQPAPDASQS
ncbi:MAG: hypothetical protein KGL18_05230 [Burkholderiales bacterium]|nr:hypothetical protein [Burkholderiales bacterium]MDE1928151.1 hypothetical protein [Burkholderiales bacterium]MDE2158363.1 hypothetical protein [Burkholderiales bacterium]MDE2502363.1 hypothetical protein [Burkholderiales bacterium]